MDETRPEVMDEQSRAETPEDVAVLYAWANMAGAPYRDFSASRREYRAQLRHRAAEAERAAAEQAKIEAEHAAQAAERAAREAEEAARFHDAQARAAAEARQREMLEMEEAAKDRALRHAQELSRRAEQERMEAQRRSEAVAAADIAARREAREMAEARASAQRQAMRYRQSEARRTALSGPQPTASAVGGQINDPYTDGPQALPGRIFHAPEVGDDDMSPSRYPQRKDVRLIIPQSDPRHPVPDAVKQVVVRDDSADLLREAGIAAGGTLAVEEALRKRTDKDFVFGEREPLHAPTPETVMDVPRTYYAEPDAGAKAAAVDTYARMAARSDAAEMRKEIEADAAAKARAKAEAEALARRPRGYQPDEPSRILPGYGQNAGYLGALSEPVLPEWLAAAPDRRTSDRRMAGRAGAPVDDTLQHSKEHIASRWYALKGVFENEALTPEPELQRTPETRVPMLAIFSLAGGVGKTSLVATLGRALSSSGEKVLLADTTSHGLLPFYFGASELRTGVVRTFSPPAGSTDAPIYLVSYDALQRAADPAAQEAMTDELMRNTRGMNRVLLDIGAQSTWLAKATARRGATMLVPVAPDMNSVISLGAVEKFFAAITGADGKPVQPVYLLNQFDAALPLHLDVREVMRRQLGDRLLPFVIRRSTTVSEALAEGMTVVDYAPEASVSGDYMNLASWLRTQSAPATAGYKNARWSER